MKKLFLSMLVVVCSIGLSGCALVDFFFNVDEAPIDSLSIVVEEPDEAKDLVVLPQEQEDVEEVDDVDEELPNDAEDSEDPDEDAIAGFYASTICMVADPHFREGMMEGENGRDDGDDSENPFLGKYGYGSDADAEAALRTWVGGPSFEQKLSDQLGASCPGRVDTAMFAGIMTDLQEQYGDTAAEGAAKICECERDGVTWSITCEGEFHTCATCCETSLPTVDPSDDVPLDAGECKRDEDCPTICEGDIMRKQGCQARDNSCVKTFETDCAQVITTVDRLGDEVYEVSNICVPGEGCVRGPVPVYERKEDLQTQRKELQAQSQELTTLYEKAAAFCLGSLVDLTGITDLVASTQDISTNSTETNTLMATVVADPTATQTSVWCTLEERLKTIDMPALTSELAILMKRVEEVDKWTDILDTQ